MDDDYKSFRNADYRLRKAEIITVCSYICEFLSVFL